MRASTTKSAQQLLDEVRRLTHLEAFDANSFLEQLAAEVADGDDGTPAGLEARDALLRAALAAIDVFASRAMRIRLDHFLADDTTVEPPFRTYLASRVLDFDGELERLRARVVEVVARVDPQGAAATATAIADAAGDVLAQRTRLRQGVLALIRVEEPQEPAPDLTMFELLELD